LKTEYINFILTAASANSINKASQMLNYPTQKLSRLITSVEKEFGIQIFERSYQGICLTQQGEIFVNKLKQISIIMHEIEALCQTGQEPTSNEDLSGIIYFNAMYALDDDYRSMILPFFLKEFPNVSLCFKESDYPDIIESMQSDLPSVGVIVRIMPYDKDKPLPPNLVFLPAYIRDIKVLAAKDCDLINIKAKSIALGSVVKHPILVFHDSITHETASFRLLSEFGKPQVKYSTESIEVFFQLLSRGNCLAVGSIEDENLANAHPNIVAIPVRDNVYYVAGLIVNKKTMDTPLIKTFTNYFFEKCVESCTYSICCEKS
jgi:DNA-binding transcriptional LysR family regulator